MAPQAAKPKILHKCAHHFPYYVLVTFPHAPQTSLQGKVNHATSCATAPNHKGMTALTAVLLK